MGWGIIRLTIFCLAFLFGALLAGFWNSTVLAPAIGLGTAELSPLTGTSLLVTCADGNPTVEQVSGTQGALQVKCAKSEMHVVRSRRSAPPEPQHRSKGGPSVPIAAILPPGQIDR